MTSVLVIDDDQQIREAIALTLRQEDYRVVCAPDGGEGENILQTDSVDVVITDIFMPNQDGLQTIMHIRRRWPSLKIIAVSGTDAGSPGYLRHAKLLGADRVLAKPFNAAQLCGAVQACVGAE